MSDYGLMAIGVLLFEPLVRCCDGVTPREDDSRLADLDQPLSRS